MTYMDYAFHILTEVEKEALGVVFIAVISSGESMQCAVLQDIVIGG